MRKLSTMKVITLVAGLLIANTLSAATSGSISVRLTLYSPCQVDVHHNGRQTRPQIYCTKPASADARVTESTLSKDVKNRQEQRLIAVEW